jgi:hypothetical protein
VTSSIMELPLRLFALLSVCGSLASGNYAWKRATYHPTLGDYTSPCTGEEPVFLCQTRETRLRVIPTSCLTVHNHNNNTATDPVLYPGSCKSSETATQSTFIVSVTEAETLCGVGATEVLVVAWTSWTSPTPTGFGHNTM